MGVTTTNNKPLNPRGNDQSPLAFNRAKLFSGKALDFDGSNDSVNLDGFTMSGDKGTFCFYADVDNDAYVFDINPNRFVFLHNENSGQGIRVFNNTGWNNYGLIDRVGVLFYTIVCDGTSQSVYVNGQQFGETQTIPSALDLSSATKVKLGSNYINTGTYLNGQLSGFKIFNTALTAAQVADLYNNPEKVVPTGVDNTALKLWLPMQEGAGTTAYDGSGNGNHGTISGATYTHGIGAPVSQTAVIDWNKGTNILQHSEEFNDSIWTKIAIASIDEDAVTAPDGSQTGNEVLFSGGGLTQFYGGGTNSVTSGLDYTISVFAKYEDQQWVQLVNSSSAFGTWYANFDIQNGVLGNISGATATISDAGNGWYRLTATKAAIATTSTTAVFAFTAVDSGTSGRNSALTATNKTVYVWGAQGEQADVIGPYIPTLSTTQTSDVLLPQGLTSGRDITGVNLFENVRKQGALNLDGNSWAEVHDNASLDVSEITAEGWMYAESITSINNRIVNKWNAAYPERSFQLYGQNNTINWMLSDGSAAYSITGGTLNQGQWHHVVGTYDGSTQKIYLNGVQVQSTALSITLKQSSFKVMLGGYTAGLYSLNPIAQPRIYNRALTAEEVLQNYNSGKNTYK